MARLSAKNAQPSPAGRGEAATPTAAMAMLALSLAVAPCCLAVAVPATPQSAPTAAVSAAAPPSPTMAPVPELMSALSAMGTELAALAQQRWRAPSQERADFLTDEAAIARNLQLAAPGLAAAAQHSPTDLGAAFRLYRDAEAVYSVALRAGDFVAHRGDEEQRDALRAPLARVHAALEAFGDSIAARGEAQNQELTRLRARVATLAAADAHPRVLVINAANGSAAETEARRRERERERARRRARETAKSRAGAKSAAKSGAKPESKPSPQPGPQPGAKPAQKPPA